MSEYLTRLANALLILKRMSLASASQHLSVPVESLTEYLRGNNKAIPRDTTTKLFYLLGVGQRTRKQAGLLPHVVHTLYVPAPGYINTARILRRGQLALRAIAPLLTDARGVHLGFTVKGYRPVLIEGKKLRVAILAPSCISTQELAQSLHIPLVASSTFKSKDQIPPEYLQDLFAGSLGILDFDALATGRFPKWGIIRAFANMHGVSLSRVLAFIAAESIYAKNSKSEEPAATQSVAADTELVTKTEKKTFRIPFKGSKKKSAVAGGEEAGQKVVANG